jgi:hypothetical protein
VLDELDWVIECAVEHLGAPRAARYLRKFYPWYVDRMGGGAALRDVLQRSQTVADARAVLAQLRPAAAA